MEDSRRTREIESIPAGTQFEEYFQSFKFDCSIRNLSSVSIEGYAERLKALFEYLGNTDITLHDQSGLRIAGVNHGNCAHKKGDCVN